MIIKVSVKNLVEFEVDDDFVMSNYDRENFLALAKQAMIQTPQSLIVSDAKYKIKGENK